MLADVNEVLVLKDGSKVMPDGRVVPPDAPKMIEIPTQTQAQRTVMQANKKLADLPTPPAHMNTISVILVYSLWGLNDTDIAIATGLTTEQIKNIRQHEAYASLQEDMLQNIIKSDQADVRSMIAQHSHAAVTTVVNLMQASDDDKVKLGAANSLLDRAGHRPADIVEHRHRMEDALRIEVIRRDETVQVPTLTKNPLTGVFEDGTSSRP